MPRQKPLLKRLKDTYGIVPEDIIIPEDAESKKIIRRSGLVKVQKVENITFEIDNMQVILVEHKGMTSDAVYLYGTGFKKNSKGFLEDKIQRVASATPWNCEYTFRGEVAENRLRARLVLELSNLGDWLSEDELNVNRGITPGSNPDEAKLGTELIQQAIEGSQVNNRPQ